jgi:general stress protein YciG
MGRKKILTVAELTSKAGKAGGKKRMASLTPEERSEFARQGGLAGGRARARKLSAKRRSEIARQAVLARWARQKGKSGPKKP